MNTGALVQKLFGVEDLYDLQALAAQIDQLTPENITLLVVFYSIHLGAGLFAIKTCSTALTRLIGASHPDHYSRWPLLPWRPVFKQWLAIQRWYERVILIGSRGSTGGFAGVLATLTLLYKPGHLLLGRASAFDIGLAQPVGIKPQRHLFCYAQTGSGKTTLLITILQCWAGSALVIDPKGQIVEALMDQDSKRTWFVIDPYRISKAAQSACINFFDCIKEAVARDGAAVAVLWALRIAEAMIITPPGARTPYFTDVSRQFLSGLILHVLTAYPEECHNLPFVRDLIVIGCRIYNEDGSEETKGDEAQVMLLAEMSKNTSFGITIPGAASALISASGEASGNVRSTLQEQSKWLDLPQIRALLRITTIPISALKTQDDMVLAVTAPITSIREELSAFNRLLTNVTLYTFQDIKESKGLCLLACDELPSQGHNASLPVLLAVARSMKLVFFGIAQNVELMRATYPDHWKSFSGEADATWWMGCTHSDSKSFLSEQLGKKTIVEKDRRTGRKSYREVQVMDADQVGRYLDPDSGNVIVTRAGGRPLRLKNEPYFKALPVWAYSPDPDHREPLLRRLGRCLFARKKTKKSETEIPAIETPVEAQPIEEKSDDQAHDQDV